MFGDSTTGGNVPLGSDVGAGYTVTKVLTVAFTSSVAVSKAVTLPYWHTANVVKNLAIQNQIRISFSKDSDITYDCAGIVRSNIDLTYAQDGTVIQSLNMVYDQAGKVEQDLSIPFTYKLDILLDLLISLDVQTKAVKDFAIVEGINDTSIMVVSSNKVNLNNVNKSRIL